MSETLEICPSLSRTELTALTLLASLPETEMFCLEMVGKSDGKLKRGTVYVTLQRLESKGLVSSRIEARKHPEIGIPRKFYQITERGRRLMRALEVGRRIFSGIEGATVGRKSFKRSDG